MITRGFLLGKFMPPHAGHVALIEAAAELVDELTVLVCWLPGDPIPGPRRLKWVEEMFPNCRVVGHGELVPQEPSESPEFWPIWRDIVARVHPERIDYVFAGEGYGFELARQVGGFFVPLGGRILGADEGIASLSGSGVRADPAGHWHFLPDPVRAHYRRKVCLHGTESTGKTTLAAQLSDEMGLNWVPEYGRSHCEIHQEPLTLDSLLLIGRAQQAMVRAAERWAGPVLLLDTDALMTAAWCEMLLGERPAELMEAEKADLYLLLEPDLPWVDDGTRFFSDPGDQQRFAAIAEAVLEGAGVRYERIGGGGSVRLEKARAAIAGLGAQ